MKKIKLIVGVVALFLGALAVYFVLQSEHALVTHPKGEVAKKELELIGLNYLLMLIIVIPTYIFLYAVAWRYRKEGKGTYQPQGTHGFFKQLAIWALPSSIIAIMTVITWKKAHELDPYRPLQSEIAPLTIQVVALDWKWLFIYPDQGIAAVNCVVFPEKTPIHFELAADGSPMNSFWIPQLSGQIYSMTGMVTQLHVMADGPGIYPGRAAEINGEGFASMTFVAQSTLQADFENWVAAVKQSPKQLRTQVYEALVKPSQNHPVTLYSYVEENLFHEIVMKHMH